MITESKDIAIQTIWKAEISASMKPAQKNSGKGTQEIYYFPWIIFLGEYEKLAKENNKNNRKGREKKIKEVFVD